MTNLIPIVRNYWIYRKSIGFEFIYSTKLVSCCRWYILKGSCNLLIQIFIWITNLLGLHKNTIDTCIHRWLIIRDTSAINWTGCNLNSIIRIINICQNYYRITLKSLSDYFYFIRLLWCLITNALNCRNNIRECEWTYAWMTGCVIH